MAYAGISALIDTEDKRSHQEMLNAVMYTRHRELWLNPPAGFKADMVALMDLAAERAVRDAAGERTGQEEGKSERG